MLSQVLETSTASSLSSNDTCVSTRRTLQHACLKSHAGSPNHGLYKTQSRSLFTRHRMNTYGAVNTNKHSGTSAPVLRADMASHCWQLSFVRRGEACWAAGRTARGSVFPSTEECLFWYSRRATVSCVSRRVCTNSPAWCTTGQPNDHSRRATERRCRSSTASSDTTT